MEMRVGDLESGDEECNLGRPVDTVQRHCDLLGDHHEMCSEVRVQVDPMIDLFNGDDERMPGSDGLDREEGGTPVVSIDESAGQVAIEDHREH